MFMCKNPNQCVHPEVPTGMLAQRLWQTLSLVCLRLPKGFFSLDSNIKIHSSAPYADARVYGIDAASAAAVMALAPARGDAVLDICCAPGISDCKQRPRSLANFSRPSVKGLKGRPIGITWTLMSVHISQIIDPRPPRQ